MDSISTHVEEVVNSMVYFIEIIDILSEIMSNEIMVSEVTPDKIDFHN